MSNSSWPGPAVAPAESTPWRGLLQARPPWLDTCDGNTTCLAAPGALGGVFVFIPGLRVPASDFHVQLPAGSPTCLWEAGLSLFLEGGQRAPAWLHGLCSMGCGSCQQVRAGWGDPSA